MKKTTKKLIGALLVAALTVTMLVIFGAISIGAEPTQTTDKYDVTGDGVNDTVYEIRTIDDFIWYYTNSSYNNRLNAILMNDLDLSAVCSETLGSWAAPTRLYLGVFDGNGKTIKNLYINTPDEESKGLFGQVYMGTIQNLTVTGSVTALEAAAGFIGRGDVSIYNSVNYVNVTVADRQGAGFIGYQSSNSVIDGCINYGTISCTGTNTATIGGIVGSYYGKITNCVNFGAISAPDALTASGIAGSGYYTNTLVENCINLGTVTARAIASEITAEGDIVNDCYYRASSTNDGVYENSDATVTNVVAVSDTELTDGSLAYTLGEGWGQEIGVDASPVPGGMKVYYTIDPATLCTAATPTYYYANSENSKVTHDESIPVEDYENGFCTICDGYQPATDSDGDGYYEIGNAGQLYWFAAQAEAQIHYNIELTSNIIVNDVIFTYADNTLTVTDKEGNAVEASTLRPWVPIGKDQGSLEAYNKTIEGNGYYISGLYCNATTEENGLFASTGSTSSGSVKIRNLGVVNSFFGGKKSYTATFIGYPVEATIQNCYSNAIIVGGSYSSGFVGRAHSANYLTVNNSFYFGTLVNDYSGGVFTSEYYHDQSIYNSYYLDGCATFVKNDDAIAVTAEQLASGELAYKLNRSVNGGTNWGQVIGTDAYPTPIAAEGEKVYRGYTTCDEAQSAPIYLNSDAVSATKPEHHDFVYAVNGSEITKHCGECNKLMGTATITATDGRYTGLPVSAAVSGTGDYAGESFVITYTDAEGNSTTTAPVAIGSYTASFTEGGVTASTEFEISKGIMSVAVSPTATHEYGDTHLDKVISAKVVIGGNEAIEVTGTWAWVGDTATATFTPDAEFVDLFEALAVQSVTVTVSEATPVITVTSPSPSIMPGMSIMLDIEAKNPYTDTPESLPANYRYVYKIGESGMLQYSTGASITIPSDTVLGETVYVYVENIAEGGKYAVAQSNTVKLLVGQVNYSEDINDLQTELDTAVAELEALISQNATKTELDAAVANLNTAITNAQSAAESFATAGDTALETTLRGAITDAETAITNAYEQAISDAKTALQSKIDEKASKDELDAAVASLNTAITNAQSAAEAFATAGDTALESKLNGVINNVKTELDGIIDGVKADLDAAKTDLQSKIDANSQKITDEAARLDGEIAAANALIDALEAADLEIGQRIDGVVKSVADARAILQAAIEGVKNDLEQTQAALEEAKADLQSKIDANDSRITSEVEALNKAIADAQAALEVADGALGVRVDGVVELLAEAQAILQSAIDTLADELDGVSGRIDTEVKTLNGAIENAKAVLEAADAANKKALEKAIETAEYELEKKIEELTNKLVESKVELANRIAETNGKIDTEVAELNELIKQAQKALGEVDAANKKELEAAISEAEDILNKAIEKVAAHLEAAEKTLRNELALGDKASAESLQAAIDGLNSAIAAAAQTATDADAVNKSSLEANIAAARQSAVLADAILKAELRAELEAARVAEAEANAALQEAIDAKTPAIVVGIVIASVAFAGYASVAVWLVIQRRKKA
ncbi:MAG: DUF1640 domain-containing protein [Clostridia bacterium]|nr:DUF1640 domain-containing protein [Clostridia bacterium]